MVFEQIFTFVTNEHSGTLGPIASNVLGSVRKGPRAGVIFSGQLKYTRKHTAGFTENNIGPAPPKADPAWVQVLRIQIFKVEHRLQ